MASRSRLRIPTITTVTVLLLALVVVSPLALEAAAKVGLDWPLLSNVGQTYGAASSILAGLALIGVAVSTMFQAHQTRVITEQSARELQMQIFSLAMKDADLRLCIGPMFSKQHLYTNVWFMYQRMRLQINDGDFPELATGAYESFQGEPGRAYWEQARSHFLEHWTDTRFNRKFGRTLEQAYQKALADYPQPQRGETQSSNELLSNCRECGATVQNSLLAEHLQWHSARIDSCCQLHLHRYAVKKRWRLWEVLTALQDRIRRRVRHEEKPSTLRS